MNILEEANALCSGDRNVDYGHPADNHRTTAALWNAYLNRKYLIPPTMLTPYDVCMLNILQKVSRDANLHKRDTILDIAGWARNMEMVAERLGGEGKPYLPEDSDVM